MSFQSAFPVCNTVLNLYDYYIQHRGGGGEVELSREEERRNCKIENPHIRRIELLSNKKKK